MNRLAATQRRFPQFGALGPSGAPLGNSWYDALQAKVTRRLSHGLELTSSFTWQKELDTLQGVFNRTVFPAISGNNPVTTPTANANGLLTGGFGFYNTSTANNVQTGGIIPASRNGQLVARFEW